MLQNLVLTKNIGILIYYLYTFMHKVYTQIKQTKNQVITLKKTV